MATSRATVQRPKAWERVIMKGGKMRGTVVRIDGPYDDGRETARVRWDDGSGSTEPLGNLRKA